jgi:hypothetical protein
MELNSLGRSKIMDNQTKQVNVAIEKVAEELISSVKNMPRCWYCESPFIREGVCDDCGKTQHIFEDEVSNADETYCCHDCGGQAVYFLKG